VTPQRAAESDRSPASVPRRSPSGRCELRVPPRRLRAAFEGARTLSAVSVKNPENRGARVRRDHRWDGGDRGARQSLVQTGFPCLGYLDQFAVRQRGASSHLPGRAARIVPSRSGSGACQGTERRGEGASSTSARTGRRDRELLDELLDRGTTRWRPIAAPVGVHLLADPAPRTRRDHLAQNGMACFRAGSSPVPRDV